MNGTKGIGTGFSTDIMCYNPKDIIVYLKALLAGESSPQVTLEPYYRGFGGKIIKVSSHKYLIKGVYEVVDKNTIPSKSCLLAHGLTIIRYFLKKILTRQKRW